MLSNQTDRIRCRDVSLNLTLNTRDVVILMAFIHIFLAPPSLPVASCAPHPPTRLPPPCHLEGFNQHTVSPSFSLSLCNRPPLDGWMAPPPFSAIKNFSQSILWPLAPSLTLWASLIDWKSPSCHSTPVRSAPLHSTPIR